MLREQGEGRRGSWADLCKVYKTAIGAQCVETRPTSRTWLVVALARLSCYSCLARSCNIEIVATTACLAAAACSTSLVALCACMHQPHSWLYTRTQACMPLPVMRITVGMDATSRGGGGLQPPVCVPLLGRGSVAHAQCRHMSFVCHQTAGVAVLPP